MLLSYLQSKSYSVLGPQCVLSGSFEFTGIVKINSFIKGEVHASSDGQLTIERKGIIQGKIFCHDLEIFGEVDGEIESTGKVIIQSSANVRGKIKCQNLCIFPGAQVNMIGHSEV